MHAIKRTINNGAEWGRSEALKLEAAASAVNFVSDDMQLCYKAMAAKEKFERK